MQKIVEINIDGLRTVSEANTHEHWGKKAKRHKMQRNAVIAFWNLSKKAVSLPCKVKLTRIAPRPLDVGDNLPMSLKIVRDAIADCITNFQFQPGRADAKDIIFEYAQIKDQKPRFYGVKIEIYV